MSAWVVTTLDAGMPVPKPDTGGVYAGHLTVHLPPFTPQSKACAPR